MERWIVAVLVASMPAVTTTTSFGQQAAEPEFALTREQWQQRIEEARRRTEGFVENSRADPRQLLPPNGRPFPDSALTRAQWQARMDEARRQSEGFVASIRTPPNAASSTDGFTDFRLTREQWQQRMEGARRQSEQFVANARGTPSATSANGDFVDSALTREQWQQRVESARRRSEEFVANARVEPPGPPSRDFQQKEASERAMNDPTLQPGDMVSTDKGIVVFVGRDEERKPGDFRTATPDKQ